MCPVTLSMVSGSYGETNTDAEAQRDGGACLRSLCSRTVSNQCRGRFAHQTSCEGTGARGAPYLLSKSNQL